MTSMHSIRPVFVAVILALALAIGCDKKPAPRPAAPSQAEKQSKFWADNKVKKEREVVGTWDMLVGKKEPGEFYTLMTLELRADKTLAWSNEMPDFADKTKTIVNRATGRWELDDRGVDMTVHLLASPDGRTIPDNQRTIQLNVGADNRPGSTKVETALMDPKDLNRIFYRR